MMKRRTFVQTAGGSALGLLGAGLPLVGHAQDRYAKYKGQTVVMSIPRTRTTTRCQAAARIHQADRHQGRDRQAGHGAA
jgi:hypothetical protein